MGRYVYAHIFGWVRSIIKSQDCKTVSNLLIWIWRYICFVVKRFLLNPVKKYLYTVSPTNNFCIIKMHWWWWYCHNMYFVVFGTVPLSFWILQALYFKMPGALWYVENTLFFQSAVSKELILLYIIMPSSHDNFFCKSKY